MAIFIYDKDTKRILRETSKPNPGLGSNEDLVIDPQIQEGTDLSQILVYDGMIRNETAEDTVLHKTTLCQRVKGKFVERAKQWSLYPIEAIVLNKALQKVLYNQLVRVSNGLPLESIEEIKANLMQEIDGWSEFDEEMMSRVIRISEGVDTSESAMSLNVIQEVGPGGS